jgi:hypothetical protein
MLKVTLEDATREDAASELTPKFSALEKDFIGV